MEGIAAASPAERRPNEIVYFDPSIARAARAFTRLTHEEFGSLADVARRTVFKIEKDGWITSENLAKILAAYRRKGVAVVYDEGGIPAGLEFRKLDSQ